MDNRGTTRPPERQRWSRGGARSDMASVVQRLDAFWREDSHSASTAPPPAQRARAVQQVDDVTAAEVQMGILRGRVVAEGVSQTSSLRGDRAET